MNRKTLFFVPLLVFTLLWGGAVYANGDHSDGTHIELPEPGITPDSRFFFLDRFFERIQLLFTFSTEKKAELHTRFAAERVAEVKAMLAKKGVDAHGLDVALVQLEKEHAAVADKLERLAQTKAKKQEFKALVEKLEGELEAQKDALKATFEEKIAPLKEQKEALEAQIEEAEASGNEELLKELRLKKDELSVQIKELRADLKVAKSKLKAEKKRVEAHLKEEKRKLRELKRAVEEAAEAAEELEEDAHDAAEAALEAAKDLDEDAKKEVEEAEKHLKKVEEEAKKALEALKE